jgi:hypothetical protein
MKRQARLNNKAVLQYINSIKQCNFVLLISAIIVLPSQALWSQEKKKNEKADSSQTIQEMVSMINTDVDPEYVYTNEKTKFVPPDGKTLLIMGQSVERITEYMRHFPNQPIPGGWSAYWGITEFNGVTESYLNEVGLTMNHQMLIDSFPNTVVQSALWMVGKWDVAKKAGNGDYDEVIKKYSAWAKSVDRPIYLRIGYEFDGPHNELEPDEYVKAYIHIVDLMRSEGVRNIAFVWHSYASPPFKGYQLSDWYPGDDYVDWVGISIFGHAYGGTDFGPDCEAVLQFAKQHQKPVMIAEANPINGIEKDNPEVWEKWFVNFLSFTYNKNIKAISFINEDWSATGIAGIADWKDGRLYNNKMISDAWFLETNKEHYLKQSPELYEQLGYKKK